MTTPAAKPSTSKASVHPLPLSSTLHDLALLRASDLDFAALLPPSTSTASPAASPETEGGRADEADVEKSVQRSLDFSREARAALKLLHADAVEKEGARVDGLREKLEDVVKGLDGRED
ncbi:hypothetical protein GY45DRAFT_1261478 [Cubamyces sp. BRFM 1775]|nr:hypothetical protein GY45DRAFT_1261478 [Cubamyces sp. BRFM 1775]